MSRDCEGSEHSSYWVVIPAYNESATIRGVVERALMHVPHVIVVDDGSTDDPPTHWPGYRSPSFDMNRTWEKRPVSGRDVNMPSAREPAG